MAEGVSGVGDGAPRARLPLCSGAAREGPERGGGSARGLGIFRSPPLARSRRRRSARQVSLPKRYLKESSKEE